jgi:hypothetical protein
VDHEHDEPSGKGDVTGAADVDRQSDNCQAGETDPQNATAGRHPGVQDANQNQQRGQREQQAEVEVGHGRRRVAETHAELRAAVVDQNYDSNLGGRVAAMKVAREVFRDHPVLGTGVGGNVPAFRHVIDTRFEKLKPSIYWYRHFHNQYAQVATELGFAGLLALAWIFWELIRAPHRRPETDAAALILATVYLLGFLGEPFFHKQVTLVMFALFAGLISAEDLEGNATDEES